MADEKKNMPERHNSISQDDLARIGIDEEGIFNFLTDAIGPDVGTEVLREFSNSDHFAELLDCVTTSLSAGGGIRSRRESVEVEEIGHNHVTDGNSHSNSSANSDIKLANITADVENICEEIPTTSLNDITTVTDVQPSQEQNTPNDNVTFKSSSLDLITLQTGSVEGVDGASSGGSNVGKELESCTVKGVSDDMKRQESTEATVSDDVEISNTLHTDSCNDKLEQVTAVPQINEIEGVSKTISNFEGMFEVPETGIKFKNLFKPYCHPDFSKYQSKLNLKPCAVILCNIIKLGDAFRALGLGYDSSKQETKTIVLTRDKIKETLYMERKMRFADRLNKSVEPEGSTSLFMKDPSGKTDKTEDKVKDKIVRKRREVESGSDSSSDIQIVKRKNDSSTKTKDVAFKHGGSHIKSKDEFSPGGTRILPFERKRIPAEENRPRKFDNFENIRMLKEKNKSVKKDSNPVVKVESNVHEKTFASSSFRIPKKKDGRTLEKKGVVLTPLASQDIPSENLKFERYRKIKSNEDRTVKQEISYRKETKETALNESIKVEFELADEPDSCGGAEDEDNVYVSQSQAPLSEVKMGHLVLGVATYLRDNPDVEFPSTEETSTLSELLVVKIAWWFTKIDTDPPTDCCYDPELTDVLLECDEDDGSDISFLGHVSNPDEEAEECQINEVSSSSNRCDAEIKPRDPNKVDELCGHALLQAKYRIADKDSLQNIFDLRNGASYDKENFQAKCNVCNELIVGKTNLAIHVRKEEHCQNLLQISLKMAKSDENQDKSRKVVTSTPDTNNKNKQSTKSSHEKNEKERDKGKSGKKDTEHADGDRNGKVDKSDIKPVRTKVEMETTKTSTGLQIKVPVVAGAKKRSRSPSRRKKSKSPVPMPASHTSHPRSKSPIQLVARSPHRHSSSRPRHRKASRSPRKRSRSPRRRSRSPIQPSRSQNRRSRSPTRRRRSSSIERVADFLARTNRGRRSRSPSNHSKRQRRSRTKSPKASIKMDNKEFHEKLALTVEGKWTAEMDRRWNGMETEQKTFLKQFQDRQNELNEKPEDHPSYSDEWTVFWEKRYKELEKEGKDPDNYNYVDEWKDYWLKRVMVLLQREGELKLEEIKRSYGMDYETLRRMRFSSQAELNVKAEVDSFLPTSARLPTPTIPLILPPSRSISDRGDDDHRSRSMSISDGGLDDSQKRAKGPSPRKSKVTVEDIKSTWENLTGQKIGGSKSEAGSSSVDSYDFDGFDLVQVLRLMCQLEQTLGIYAQQVQEYFKTAEELELSKKNKSYTLLNKEDFVNLMFRCRDKFMKVIRANVVARDVLKTINLTVYALNAILDSPQCRKFKPPLDSNDLSSETTTTTIIQDVTAQSLSLSTHTTLSNVKEFQVKSSGSVHQKVDNRTGNPISRAMAHLSLSQKAEIADVIATTLLSQGWESISDSALMDHLLVVLAPFIKEIPSVTPNNPATTSGPNISTYDTIRRRANEPSVSLFSNSSAKNEDGESNKIIATRAVGTALPPLPSYTARAASPPPSATTLPPPLQFSNPFGPGSADRTRTTNSHSSSQYHPYGAGRGFVRGRPSSPNTGRRSPFSRRGYAGNPAPQDQGSEGEEEIFYTRERRSSESQESCTLKKVYLNEAVSALSNELLKSNKEILGVFSPPSSISVSSEDIEDVPGSVKLPPGIRNLIKRERQKGAEVPSQINSSLSINKVSGKNLKRKKKHKRSPSERKENEGRDNRRGRRHSTSKKSDRRDRRESKDKRHKRSRCARSDSSESGIIVRHPLQSTSEGVNHYRKIPPYHVTSFESLRTEEIELSDSELSDGYGSRLGVESTEAVQKKKTVRGVSAVFWEASPVSGAEGNCERGTPEHGFSEEKCKVRHYRKQKVELEPGEILSSSDFSTDMDSAEESGFHASKPKSSVTAKHEDATQKAISTKTTSSQGSIAEFENCMVKEHLNPIDDLNTSFDDRDESSRKIQMDFVPTTIAPVKESVYEVSDGSVTDFESDEYNCDNLQTENLSSNSTTETMSFPATKSSKKKSDFIMDEIPREEKTFQNNAEVLAESNQKALIDLTESQQLGMSGSSVSKLDICKTVRKDETSACDNSKQQTEETNSEAMTTVLPEPSHCENKSLSDNSIGPSEKCNTMVSHLSSAKENDIKVSECLNANKKYSGNEGTCEIPSPVSKADVENSKKLPKQVPQEINISINKSIFESGNEKSDPLVSHQSFAIENGDINVCLNTNTKDPTNEGTCTIQPQVLDMENSETLEDHQEPQIIISINKNIFEPEFHSDDDSEHEEGQTNAVVPTFQLQLNSESASDEIANHLSDNNESHDKNVQLSSFVGEYSPDATEALEEDFMREKNFRDGLIEYNSNLETKVLTTQIVIELDDLDVNDTLEVTEEFLQ